MFADIVLLAAFINLIYIAIKSWLNQPEKITFILTNDQATPPERGTHRSAGYDLKSSENSIVPARSRKAIKTGVKVLLPSNTYGRIASRSGLSFKHGIEVGAGVIDEDYRNELMVILHNHSDVDFVVEEKHRIAQIIIERVVYPTTIIEDINGQIQTSDTCIRSVRGLGGFGSTGTK
jgi:dUTP pyrophosphatase